MGMHSRSTMGAVAVGLALAVGACRTTSVATQNLDAVLGSNDRLRYQGDTTSVFKDMFSSAIERLTLGFAESQVDAANETIKNPTKVGLENLILLARSRQGPEAWRRNEQVRILARYARFAPSQLLRERALLELGAHGKRLGIPAEFERLEEPANAADLMVRLDGLVAATDNLLARRSSPTAKADFEAAIELLASGEYDVQGGTRVLRALGPFLRGSRLPSETRARLEELSLGVQRRMVREALQYGFGDRSSVARAAAFRSGVEAFGDPFLVEATLRIVPDRLSRPEIRQRFNAFAIPGTPPEFTEAHVVVSEALQASGLPLAARRGDADSLELQILLYSALHFVALNDLLFPIRSRNAAMRALGALSGEELVTYREEEWDEWFKRRADQLGTEVIRLRREAAAAEQSGSS